MKNFTNPKSEGRVDLIKYAKTGSCKNRIGEVLNSINKKATVIEAKDRLKSIITNLVKHDIIKVFYKENEIILNKPASEYRSKAQKDWPEESGLDALIRNYYWLQEEEERVNSLQDRERLVGGGNLYSVFRESTDPIRAMNKLLKEAAHKILTEEEKEKDAKFEEGLDI